MSVEPETALRKADSCRGHTPGIADLTGIVLCELVQATELIYGIPWWYSGSIKLQIARVAVVKAKMEQAFDVNSGQIMNLGRHITGTT